MKYEPEYAEGQILVHFKIPVAHGFAETLGEFLGYKALEESYSYGDNVFIYETGKGKEKQALKKFLEQKPWVCQTSRRCWPQHIPVSGFCAFLLFQTWLRV